MEKEYLICHNCGAEIEALDAKCPHCEAMNYVGAEAKYIRDLNKIKDNLEKLDEIPGRVYKSEMTSQIKRIIIIAAVAGAVFVLVFLGIRIYQKQENSKQEDYFADPKEQILWDRDNFPRLNQWYEEEEYDELLEYLMTLLESERPFSYINWAHQDFLFIYSEYKEVMDFIQRIDNQEEWSEYHVASSLYGALKICFNLEKEGLDKEETERAKTFQESAELLLYDKFRLTEEQALKIYEDVSGNGFMDYIKTEQYAADIMKELSPKEP